MNNDPQSSPADSGGMGEDGPETQSPATPERPQTASPPAGAEPDWVAVARLGAIAEGASDAFSVRGRMIALFRIGEKYFAIDDFCPHMGASLVGGAVQDGCVSCPWHAWRFRLSDGTWCDNPRLSIPTYPVRVVDDRIEVAIPATPSESERPPDTS